MTYDINQHPNIKEIIAAIITAVIGGILVLCCQSCRTSTTIDRTYTEINSDSTYHNTKDSVFISSHDNATDSVVTNTVIYVTLDSIGNETKRVEYHDTYHSKVRDIGNTKVSVHNDTIYKTKYKMVNSVIYKTVVKEAAFTIFQKALMTAGKAAIIVLFIALLVLAWKKRKLLHIC